MLIFSFFWGNFSDGKLEVVVPSFVHYLEVLEGTDGDKVPGVPSFSHYLTGMGRLVIQ